MGCKLANKRKTALYAKVFVLLLVFCGAVVSNGVVFAEPYGWVGYGNQSVTWTGGGGGDCSSGANDSYMAGCNGYSWVYYESQLAEGENVAEVLFRPDMTNSSGSETSKDLVIPAECSKSGGGFWHFGQNARGISNSSVNYAYAWFGNTMYVNGVSSNPYTYSVGRGSYGHMFTVSYGNGSGDLRDPRGSLGQSLYANGRLVYSAARHDLAPSPSTDVNNEYSAWYAFLISYKHYNHVEYTGSNYPSDLWAFCYHPDWAEPEYFTKSEVVIDEDNNPQGKSTGVSDATVSQGLVVEVSKTGYGENDTAVVKFTPNIYASQEVDDNKNWTITRTFEAGNDVNYEVEVVKGSKEATESGTNNLKVECSIGDTYYTATNCDQIREDEFKITFKSLGEVRICEYIEIQDEDRKTGACAKFTVNQSNEFLAKSNVAIKGGPQDFNFATTEVVSEYTEASVFEENIELNSEREVIFSHNIYSKRTVDGIEWQFGREGFDGDGYEVISQELCPTTWYSSSKANFRSLEIGSSDLYYGEPEGASRSCTDGTYYYIVREVYKIKLVAENKTITFCETISIDSDPKTKVCAKLSTSAITEDDPPGGSPPTGCDRWTPSSYTASGPEAGWTSVVAKVINRNRGVDSDWVDSTWARPDDDINWAFCYYPGVQRTWDTQATYNHVSESPGSPDDSYTLYTKDLYLFGSPWQNFYKLSKNGNYAPLFNGYTEGSGTGDDSILDYFTDERGTTYTIEKGPGRNKAGNTLWGIVTSGVPTYASISNRGPHSWKCHWSDDDCENCGSYSCNCTTTTNEDGSTTEECDTCCYSCYKDICEHVEDYIAHTITNVPAVDQADVKIPYNFLNRTAVAIRENPVYAGETMHISNLNVTVGLKQNDITKDKYITHVDNAKIKLVAYLSAQGSGSPMESVGSGRDYNICGSLGVYAYEECDELDVLDGLTLNANGTIHSDVTENYTNQFGETYSVYDGDAGKYFCVVSALYPANSAEDTNLLPQGSDSWYVSAPDCKLIAKRPSFQVRGGSVYSSNSIRTSVSKKNNVRGVFGYTPTNRGLTVVFGSWAEQSVISNGVVSGFASGAATGMTGSVEGKTTSYCNSRVPISFANYSQKMIGLCPTTEQTGQQHTGGSGIAINGGKDTVANYWLPKETVASIAGNTVNLAATNGYVNTTTLAGEAIRYTYKNGNLRVTSNGTIGAGITHVVRVDGNLSIESDLLYNDGETYNSVDNIPKMIIYVKGNINVSCNVGRIDAIVATEGTLNTCADANGNVPDINDPARSRQLVVNGAIMANKLVLGRTYGAGAGRASAIPAEILNYDTSVVLWGRSKAEGDDTGTMMTVYQHELAPRR
ncbi:hypothetical protein IKX73_00285 [Candidatus Saccharibacteria bacterium]|nr:hypothetical protein [Candidatus Saccharibacteria bacterium]